MDYIEGDTEEEAIANFIAYIKRHGPVEFSGIKSCWGIGNSCDGWDGGRRCGCGNQKVYVATRQSSDGKWTAWATAD